MRRNHAETHSECIDQAAPRCQIFQWQRFRYSAINSRDIAKGLRNDTAHTYGLPCQQKVVERWLTPGAFQAMRETSWLSGSKT